MGRRGRGGGPSERSTGATPRGHARRNANAGGRRHREGRERQPGVVRVRPRRRALKKTGVRRRQSRATLRRGAVGGCFFAKTFLKERMTIVYQYRFNPKGTSVSVVSTRSSGVPDSRRRERRFCVRLSHPKSKTTQLPSERERGCANFRERAFDETPRRACPRVREPIGAPSDHGRDETRHLRRSSSSRLRILFLCARRDGGRLSPRAVPNALLTLTRRRRRRRGSRGARRRRLRSGSRCR